MKKYILLLLFGTIIFSACEQTDLTNGYELPKGDISGKLVWEGSNTVAPNYYVQIVNDDNGKVALSLASKTGTFSSKRMLPGNYSVSIFNDSVASPEIAFALADDQKKDLGVIEVKILPYPDSDVVLVSKTSTSLTLRVDITHRGHATFRKGTYHLLSSDPRDAEDGKLSKTDPYGYAPNRDYYDQTITGLTPNTEYKVKAWLEIRRGVKANGSQNVFKVLSPEKTFTTAVI